jgi:Conjugative transposon protein TcpC
MRVVGRVALWCVVAILLLRGASDVMAVEEPAPVKREPQPAAAGWPDDPARAFAVGFARAYMTFEPKRPSAYARAVERFVAPELAASVLPQFEPDGPGQVVRDATVARVARVDDRRALITVAVTLEAERVSIRYLTVPVARDGQGGLVVSDLPSFAPPPELGRDSAAAELEPLTGAERAEVEDVLSRFFSAFLAGDSAQLEYLVPAGVRIAALEDPHELVAVGSIAQLGGSDGRARTVLASVRARDEASGAVFGLRYRLQLVQGDRWYVAAVNQTTPKEG